APAAIPRQDLDCSVQLHPHGNLAQVNATYGAYYRAETSLTNNMISGYSPPQTPYPYALGLAQVGQSIPRGLGFGPAEVSFLNIFNNGAAVDPVAYGNVLRTRYVSQLSGDVVGPTTAPAPGLPGVRDGLAAVKHNGIPNDYANTSNNPSQTYANWY